MQYYYAEAKNVPEGAKHVFIALLAGRPVVPELLEFFWQTQADLRDRGFHASLYMIVNNCHVDDSRCMAIWKFRQSKCTHFLFIDDDVCASSTSVGDLLELNREIVAGSYTFKDDKDEFPIRLLPDGRWEIEVDGCAEVEMVPTGFLMMQRQVIEKMSGTVRYFYNKEVPKDGSKGGIPLLFERTLDEVNDRWGGDYNFCRKLLAQGYKIYIKPDIWFRHYGVKAFTGNLAVSKAKRLGSQTHGFDQAIDAIQNGVGFDAHFMNLTLDWGNDYCLPADALQAAYLMACEAEGPILETGSGLSTIILGLAAEKAGQKVYALEHDPSHYKTTMEALKRYGITSVRLLYCPLRPIQYLEERSCLWYSNLDELPQDFSLVLLDGPQRKWGRDGLFKILPDRIVEAKILADDGDDKIELAMLENFSRRTDRKMKVFEGTVRAFVVLMPSEALKLSTVA